MILCDLLPGRLQLSLSEFSLTMVSHGLLKVFSIRRKAWPANNDLLIITSKIDVNSGRQIGFNFNCLVIRTFQFQIRLVVILDLLLA